MSKLSEVMFGRFMPSGDARMTALGVNVLKATMSCTWVVLKQDLIGLEHLLRREKEGPCFVTERLIYSLSKHFGSSSATINALTLVSVKHLLKARTN